MKQSQQRSRSTQRNLNKSSDNVQTRNQSQSFKRQNVETIIEQIEPFLQKIQYLQEQIIQKEYEIQELKKSTQSMEKLVSESKRKANRYKKIILTLQAKNPQEQMDNQKGGYLNSDPIMAHIYSITPSSDQDMPVSPEPKIEIRQIKNRHSSVHYITQSGQNAFHSQSSLTQPCEINEKLYPQTSRNQAAKLVNLSIPTINTEEFLQNSNNQLNKSYGCNTAKFNNSKGIVQSDLKKLQQDYYQDDENLTLDDLKKLLVNEENRLQQMQKQSEDAINKSMQVVKGLHMSIDNS